MGSPQFGPPWSRDPDLRFPTFSPNPGLRPPSGSASLSQPPFTVLQSPQNLSLGSATFNIPQTGRAIPRHCPPRTAPCISEATPSRALLQTQGDTPTSINLPRAPLPSTRKPGAKPHVPLYQPCAVSSVRKPLPLLKARTTVAPSIGSFASSSSPVPRGTRPGKAVWGWQLKSPPLVRAGWGVSGCWRH